MRVQEQLESFRADWIDVGFIKVAVFAATLLFAKLWEPILALDWYWYLVIAVAAVIRPLLNTLKWMSLAASKQPHA